MDRAHLRLSKQTTTTNKNLSGIYFLSSLAFSSRRGYFYFQQKHAERQQMLFFFFSFPACIYLHGSRFISTSCFSLSFSWIFFFLVCNDFCFLWNNMPAQLKLTKSLRLRRWLISSSPTFNHQIYCVFLDYVLKVNQFSNSTESVSRMWSPSCQSEMSCGGHSTRRKTANRSATSSKGTADRVPYWREGRELSYLFLNPPIMFWT